MVYPYTFNADDFEPITGRVHQPPPVQQTFDAPGFVVCTFAPRMLDTDPAGDQGAVMPIPTCRPTRCCTMCAAVSAAGRASRKASFTLHPRGIPHGPHPGTIAASRDATPTDELAVMVDTVQPLHLTRQAMQPG